MGKANLLMKKRSLSEPTVADTVAAAVAAAVAGNIHHPEDPDYEAVTAAAVAASAARDIYDPEDEESQTHGPNSTNDHHRHRGQDQMNGDYMGFSEMPEGDYHLSHGQDSTASNDVDVNSHLSHYVHVEVNADDMAADPTATAAAEQASRHYTSNTNNNATHLRNDADDDDDDVVQNPSTEDDALEQQQEQEEHQQDFNHPTLHTNHYQEQIHDGGQMQQGTLTMEHLSDPDDHHHAHMVSGVAVDAATAAAAASIVHSAPALMKRKDKSLGVLCVNFMHRYDLMKVENPDEIPEVSIDEAASKLAVEKRRIYDIINILEAIDVVSRKCKNTYNWHGMDGLEEVFRRLQKEAVVIYPEGETL